MSKVIYYHQPNGKNPVYEFIESLEKRQKEKLIQILRHIQEYGLTSIIPHLKS